MIRRNPLERIRRRGTPLVWGRAPSPVHAGRSPAVTAVRAAAFFCGVALTLLGRPATAAELAILRNGFSIRHEHRLVMGTNTRLYLGADDSSFTDVPTEEITGYEKDLSLPQSPSPLPAPPTSHASISAPLGPPTFESATSSSMKSRSAKFVPAPALNQVVNS